MQQEKNQIKRNRLKRDQRHDFHSYISSVRKKKKKRNLGHQSQISQKNNQICNFGIIKMNQKIQTGIFTQTKTKR